MLHRYYTLLVILHCLVIISSQVLSFFGLFALSTDPLEYKTVSSKCFPGIGMVSCQPVLPTDDLVLDYQMPYFKSLGSLGTQTYCLQCCGTPPDYIDYWNDQCPITVTQPTSQYRQYMQFQYEIRLARKKTLKDTGVITCPLKRSFCSYNSDGSTKSCNNTAPEKNYYLIGYDLTIWVEQYEENFVYWNGVSKCEATAIANASFDNDYLSENIILIHTPLSQPIWDNAKILILLIFIIFVVYGLLYFCRRKHCPYCQNKLIWSRNLCLKCWFVGAELPDPVLMKALEDKGLQLQGVPPERFPCARFCTNNIRRLFKSRILQRVVVPLNGNIDTVESKEQTDIESNKPDSSFSSKSGKKKKKENPNLLKYAPDVIYEGINHPKFAEQKTKDPKKKKDKPIV